MSARTGFRFAAALLVGTTLSNHSKAANSLDALIGDWARILELQSINQTEAIILQGPDPAKWPNRAFVPQSTVTSAIKLLEGAAIRFPIGNVRNNRVDGYVVVGVAKADIVSRDAGLGAKLSLFAAYERDLLTPPWSNTRLTFDVSAMLLSANQQVLDNHLITYFKILPLTVGTVNVPVDDGGAVNGLLSLLGSVSALNALTQKLQIPIPAPNMPVDLSMETDTEVPMKDGDDTVGSATLHFSMKRKPQELVAFDRFVMASNGIWLLGGLPPKAIPVNPAGGPAPSPASLLQAEQKLAKELAPFKNTRSLVEISLSSEQLTGFARRLVSDPLDIIVTTKKSEGVISTATPFKDNVLGDVGYYITPNGTSFLQGHITGTFEPPAWSGSQGLLLNAEAKAQAVKAEAVVHVQAGRVDEDIEKQIQLKDHGNVSLDLRLAVEKHDLKFKVLVKNQAITITDSAVMFRPRFACTKASLNFAPSDNVTASFATISPLQLRIVQGLGSETIKPSVMFDNLPLVIEAPHERDKDGKIVSRLPDHTVFSFKRPYIQATFAPDSATTQSSGIDLRTSLSLAPRDVPQTDIEKAARAFLTAALLDQLPKPTCDKTLQLYATAGGIQVLNITTVLKFLSDMANARKKITQDAWNAATKLVNATPDEIINAAPKIVGTGIDDWKNEIDTARKAARDAGIRVPPIPAPPKPPQPPAAPHVNPPPGVVNYCQHNDCKSGPGGAPIPIPHIGKLF
jgi:hypothetical protein